MTQPSLVVLGGDDTNTPTTESAERLCAAFARSGHRDSEVVVFEGLGHDLGTHSGPMSAHGLDPDVPRTLGSRICRAAGAAR